MLDELGNLAKFFKKIQDKKNPLDWKTYLELTAIWGPFVDGLAKSSNMPGMDKELASMMSPEVMDYTWIPINKRLESQGSTVVPIDMLKEMISRTSHRVIARQCFCRQGFACEHYPKDLGCIYMGEATKDFDPDVAIHATVEQALEHVDKCINIGLVPDVGKIDFDAHLFGAAPNTHFATICFCCDCCCLPRRYSTTFFQPFRDRMFKLEGLSIKVDGDKCTGCGTCVDRCFMGAISLNDNEAVIDEQECKGCGVCVEQCPEDAITIEITDGKKMEKAFFERLESKIDLYSSIPGKEVNMTPRGRIPHPRHGLKIPKYRHSREIPKGKQKG